MMPFKFNLYSQGFNKQFRPVSIIKTYPINRRSRSVCGYALPSSEKHTSNCGKEQASPQTLVLFPLQGNGWRMGQKGRRTYKTPGFPCFFLKIGAGAWGILDRRRENWIYYKDRQFSRFCENQTEKGMKRIQMKQFVSIVAMVFAVLVIGGCGASSGDPATTQSQPAQEANPQGPLRKSTRPLRCAAWWMPRMKT